MAIEVRGDQPVAHALGRRAEQQGDATLAAAPPNLQQQMASKFHLQDDDE